VAETTSKLIEVSAKAKGSGEQRNSAAITPAIQES
jgi:hypothetical protein